MTGARGEHYRLFRRLRAIALVVAVAGVGFVSVGGATAAVNQVGGGAFGEQIRGLVSSGPTPSVSLPKAGGGPFTASTANVKVAGLLQVGALSVRTQGVGVGTSAGYAQSSAALSSVNVLAGVVTADQVASQCRSSAEGSVGSLSLVNLRVAGIPIRTEGTVSVPIPDGTVIVHERVKTNTTGATGITVNGLRITVLNSVRLLRQEIILAQSRCQAIGPDVNPKPTSSTSTSSTSSTTSTTAAPTECVLNCTIFENTVPGTVDAGDDLASVELGVKFRADVPGTVTGVRFYKSAANTGTHVGNLWSADGTLLASATFTSETPSGWQQVTFATPVVIAAWPSTYVASYHTDAGHYSFNPGFFSFDHYTNPPLLALEDQWEGPNGVYTYAPSGPGAFPVNGNGGTNYWVDVLFTPAP